MSQKTQERRVRNLTKRLEYYESRAAKCLGKNGYCCTFDNGKGDRFSRTMETPGCYKHDAIEGYGYRDLKERLEKVKARISS